MTIKLLIVYSHEINKEKNFIHENNIQLILSGLKIIIWLNLVIEELYVQFSHRKYLLRAASTIL